MLTPPLACSTYGITRDKTSALWFNYTNTDLGNGTFYAADVVVHMHQSMMDSYFLFKGENVYAALEKYRVENEADNLNAVDLRSWLPFQVPASRSRATAMKHDVMEAIKNYNDDAGTEVELLCEVQEPCMECRKGPGWKFMDSFREIKTMLCVDAPLSLANTPPCARTLTVLLSAGTTGGPTSGARTSTLGWTRARR
jgi:hypothetical protein